MTEMFIPLCDAKVRTVYAVEARGFIFAADGVTVKAVYAGDGKFIGVRVYFGKKYLDTELHHDIHAYFGTVKIINEICELEPTIELDLNDDLDENKALKDFLLA